MGEAFTRHSLRPPSSRGSRTQSSGGTRRENIEACLRHLRRLAARAVVADISRRSRQSDGLVDKLNKIVGLQTRRMNVSAWFFDLAKGNSAVSVVLLTWS